ncbi:10642_t:CDS:2, partial [Dentiscutata heterogama]
MIHNRNKKIKIPTKYCKLANIKEEIKGKTNSKQINNKTKKEKYTSEKEFESESENNIEGECDSTEVEAIYLSEEKEIKDFNLEPVTDSQEVQFRTMMTKYKSTFMDES